MLSPPPTACKIQAIVMKNVQLNLGVIVSTLNSCAGVSPNPKTTTKARITKIIPIKSLALPAIFVTLEIQETPLMQTQVVIQKIIIESTAIIFVLCSPSKIFFPKKAYEP